MFKWIVLLALWPLTAFADAIDDFLTAPANPLNLTLTLEDDAETAIIGPDGGKLKLKSSAGDSFVLTIPPGALLTDTRITATPIASTTGLPDGAGTITGVVLKPDGLELAQTATLEITPKSKIPPESRLHWGFYADGADAFLHIPVPGSDRIVIPIDHFSGAGVSFADRANLQLDRWKQTRMEDRIRTEIAMNMKVAGLIDIGATADTSEAIGAEAARLVREDAFRLILRGWQKLVASPAADCETIETATRSINEIDKLRQLLGADDSLADQDLTRKFFDRYWQMCFPEKVKICQSTGDLPQLAAFALAYERQRQLIGVSGEAEADPKRSAELRAAMEACGRYKLTVDASGQWKDNAGVYGTTSYKVEVPIRLQFTNPDLLTYTLEGEGPPTGQSVTFVDYACWKLDSSHGGAPMLARLQSLEFRADHTPLRLDLKMRAAEVMAVVTCPTNRFKKTIENDVAWVVWAVAHRKDRVGRGFGLKTMKAGSHPKIFTYFWEGSGSDQGTTASDTTRLTLDHIGG